MQESEKWDCESIASCQVTFDGIAGTLEVLKRDNGHYAVVFWFKAENDPTELIGDLLERPSSEAEAVAQYLAYAINPTRQLPLFG